MKVSDLRLGNIISDENNNTCKVYSINNDCIIAKYFNVGSALGGIEAFKPIPITEEWLVKFGFDKLGVDFVKENFRFNINQPCNFDGFLFCDGSNVITEKIKSVNQLQNLYHAITGEELTIKTK